MRGWGAVADGSVFKEQLQHQALASRNDAVDAEQLRSVPGSFLRDEPASPPGGESALFISVPL